MALGAKRSLLFPSVHPLVRPSATSCLCFASVTSSNQKETLELLIFSASSLVLSPGEIPGLLLAVRKSFLLSLRIG